MMTIDLIHNIVFVVDFWIGMFFVVALYKKAFRRARINKGKIR